MIQANPVNIDSDLRYRSDDLTLPVREQMLISKPRFGPVYCCTKPVCDSRHNTMDLN